MVLQDLLLPSPVSVYASQLSLSQQGQLTAVVGWPCPLLQEDNLVLDLALGSGVVLLAVTVWCPLTIWLSRHFSS